ncbi:DMT family transporter [Rheinheimera sp.]|jgi:drug/metabolite transporter (DMT)-like permease|uniref:DMT family transporter n=1 Tax=Rheinheimera sp. TaxID=1869214 RepID=UPI0037C7F5B9
MLNIRAVLLTILALLAFAGNSVLCRMALAHTSMDAASFTTVRLLSGALMLWLLVVLRQGAPQVQGSWLSALALFVYAAGFSFAYLQLNTGIGALILFGAVQSGMIGYGLWRGERFSARQWLGLLMACSGLTGLLLPGLSAPPLMGSMLMLTAGFAWAVYSLRGKGAANPLQVTAGNFIRTLPMTLLLSVVLFGQLSFDNNGMLYAVLSGALTSGVGYAIWYSVLPQLKATTAATVQLTVPVLAAIAGILILSEPLTQRLILASVAILGGIALVVLTPVRRIK